MNDIAGHLAQAKSNQVPPPKKSTVTVRIEPDGRIVKLDGRAGWLMRVLVNAGKRGVTTIDLPAGVRVSHAVYLLRRAGFIISSPRESHGGPFAGTHSRYTLQTEVTIVDDMAAAA